MLKPDSWGLLLVSMTLLGFAIHGIQCILWPDQIPPNRGGEMRRDLDRIGKRVLGAIFALFSVSLLYGLWHY